GTTITPIITTNSGVTTVHYQPPTTLALNSTNTVLIAFTDSAANRRTNSYRFVVENILTQLWVIPPASATNATWAKWVNSGGLERGLAYNPKTGHVLLVSRGAATGTDGPAGGGVGVFDGNTGLFIKKLDLGTGIISGGTFAVNMVDVGDDGAIYVCNLATSAAQNFRIYRWQDENSTPTIAFSGSPSAAAGSPRWGDDFSVRGSGAGTQIIASGNNASANTVPVFSTTNGTDFVVSVLVPTGLPNASVRLGLAFGCGNTFYGETTGGGNPVRYVAFNGPLSTVASLTASYTIVDKAGVQSIGPIGVDIANQRLIGDSTTGGSAPHSMNLFDLNLLAATPTVNTPIDSKSFAVSVGTFGTGAVDFTPDGSRVYTLDSGSGVIAFSLAPKLAAPSICAQPQNHIVPAGNLGFFGVGAIGSTMSYQWRLNGIPVSGATNRTLDIPNVQTGNLGNYTVVITNSLGSVTSSSALLDFPLIITNPPASQVIAVGSPATFSVEASGFTPFTYQWKLNGTNIAGATASSLTVTNAQVANAGGYTVVVTDPLALAATSVVAGLTVGTLGSGTGLNGDYYTDQLQTFTNAPTLIRIDPTIDFDWIANSPDPLISIDHFTVRWTGQVQPLYSQTYTFYTRTDDGVRLWVNGQKVIDKWVTQPATEWSGTITLAANQKYDVVLEYYENAVFASAALSWSSTGQAKQIIPQTQLYPPAFPLNTTLGSSFNGTNQVLDWVGSFHLQSATNVVGPYVDVPGVVVGPYTNNVGAAPEMFYRLRNQ
ncbi:MAG: hypothetical protein JWR69_1910, partial [Pedosphaera sp.]|nr:hypothetical protein [Pedosphaera sp.]